MLLIANYGALSHGVTSAILLSLSKDVFEGRTSTGSGLFLIFGRWFCPNFWTNRLFNSKDI